MTVESRDAAHWLTRSSAEPFAYLTTIGRRTGRSHRIEIWFAVQDGVMYMLAGGRERADWVRNLQANPRVMVELGSETHTGVARILVAGSAEDSQARALLVTKYRAGDNLDEWGRTALPVAIGFLAEDVRRTSSSPMHDVIPDSHSDLLSTTALAHVATIGPDGEPQSSPVWFDWDGTHLRFAQVSGYQQKLRNLEREPRLALSIVDPENAYRYLEVRGTVERIDPDPDWTFINAMARKYLGQDRYPFGKPDDEWRIVVIRPERTTAMG